MKKLITGCLMLTLSGAAGTVTASAQVTDSLKKAGQATTEAGKDVGEAAKDTGKATVETTKKGATKAKAAVTGQSTATCADGKVMTAKTDAAAQKKCAHHGGLKP